MMKKSNIDRVLSIMDGLDENMTVCAIERNTQESTMGSVDNVYQWIINMNNKHENCEFDLI